MDEPFSIADLHALRDAVLASWRRGAARDWSAPAGTLTWTCRATAVHAIDCVFAPAFFLASGNRSSYPPVTVDVEGDADALVEGLAVAVQVLTAVVETAAPDAETILFRRPSVVLGRPADVPPRAALELALHAHDIALGLDVPFDPSSDLCRRLRDHTRTWPMWSAGWADLPTTQDPWSDLLTASGRRPTR